MISEDIKNRMDPEVYEFYKGALEGRGFSMPFTAADIPFIREDELTRHAASTDLYPCTRFDLTVDREDAEPLPLRIYRPSEAEKSDGKLRPVILYFHGGGFIMGSIYDHDPLCGKIADEAGAVVISVEYRLAPEYPFPACIDDARDSLEWAAEHARDFGGDPECIMAGGDSSGANISAALALMAKEDEKLPELQFLILFYGVYGCYDLESSESAREFGGGGFVLPNDMMESCMELYLPKDKYPDGIYTADQRLAPGRDGNLSGFPASVIVSAEFDPLRDDSEAFAEKLKEAGSRAELIRMDGMMHGFILYWQRFSKAEKLLEKIGKMVRKESRG